MKKRELNFILSSSYDSFESSWLQLEAIEPQIKSHLQYFCTSYGWTLDISLLGSSDKVSAETEADDIRPKLQVTVICLANDVELALIYNVVEGYLRWMAYYQQLSLSVF